MNITVTLGLATKKFQDFLQWGNVVVIARDRVFLLAVFPVVIASPSVLMQGWWPLTIETPHDRQLPA